MKHPTKISTVRRGGKTYVLVEQAEYERLAGARSILPPLPPPDAAGNVDAVAYARASIAREVIARREAAGMTQTELAGAAGIRVETLNRIERARHTADVVTVTKIAAALSRAASTRRVRPLKRGAGLNGGHVNASTTKRYRRAGRPAAKK